MNLDLKNLYKKYEYLIKPFFIIMLIYFLTFSSIIRANYNYGDDVERMLYGVAGWTNFSRFTTELLSFYIHTNSYLTDISPLTQYIAIFILSLSSISLLYLFKKDKKITFINILSVMFVGICPYFLSCFSYKYDSPYMALSIFASIFPFVFYKDDMIIKKDKIVYVLAVIVGTIIMCTTYQAASGILPLVSVFLAFNLWNDKKEKKAFRLIGFTFVSYFIGLLIFKLFIVRPSTSYATETMFSIGKMIPGFTNNLLKYYNYLFSDFRILWFLFITLIMIGFVVSKVINSKQNKRHVCIVSVLFIVLSLLMVFGLYPCLEKTIYAPRAMYAVGTLLALYGINITSCREMYFSKFMICCLVYCFITFAFTYGNCLSVQKSYVDFKLQLAASSLNELDLMKASIDKELKIEGDMGISPVILNMPDKYENFIIRIVESRYWNNYYLGSYYDLGNVDVHLKDVDGEYDLKLVEDTIYYSIFIDYSKNFIVLRFK